MRGSHLCIIKSGEDLLVFSKTSGRLYGFDQFGASIFSFLKERMGTKEDLLNEIRGDISAHSLIYTIDSLLKGREEPEAQRDDFIILEYPLTLSNPLYNNPFYYQLDDFMFLIDTDNELIIEKILPPLSHLKCKQKRSNEISLNIGFMSKDDRWSICFNGKIIHNDLALNELMPRVIDYIRIAYYRSTNYLISLHAGALYFNKTSLILPASSGSGKSTLSTYLMYQENFEFLSDEVVMIDRNSRIYPIPMAITIKEGSWKVLESYNIFLKPLAVHKRFDGQNLRFLPPRNIATENLSVDGAYMIFPKYTAGANTELNPLSTLEALNIITTSGYEVIDSYDEATVTQWIKILENLNKYTITYSDLKDAQQHIERLMAAK